MLTSGFTHTACDCLMSHPSSTFFKKLYQLQFYRACQSFHVIKIESLRKLKFMTLILHLKTHIDLWFKLCFRWFKVFYASFMFKINLSLMLVLIKVICCFKTYQHDVLKPTTHQTSPTTWSISSINLSYWCHLQFISQVLMTYGDEFHLGLLQEISTNDLCFSNSPSLQKSRVYAWFVQEDVFLRYIGSLLKLMVKWTFFWED